MLGQDAVVTTLCNAISSGTLGHAYLFSGLRGVGKTTVARLLAKAVNCIEGPTIRPCGRCTPCQEIAAGSSLDVVELDGASNRGIDDVRELKELLRYQPTRDRSRVILIDEVHMLTREAFNALLKSLEEPPPYILFLFATTERHKVPATILSRCQQLEFRPVASPIISAHLISIAATEQFELTEEAAEAVARAAEGSVRDALSLLDQLRAFSGDRIDADATAAVLGVPRFEQTLAVIDALTDGRPSDALNALTAELTAGRDATVLFHEIGRTLRTLLHQALGTELESLSADHAAASAPLASRLTPDALTRMLGLWIEHESLLREARHRELALEVAALRLARWPSVQQIESFLGRGQITPPSGPASNEPASQTRSSTNGPSDPPPPVAGAAHTLEDGGDAAGSSSHPAGSAGATLVDALLERQSQRLGAAVDRAQCELTDGDGTLRLRFSPEDRALAEHAHAAYAELLAVATETLGVTGLDLVVPENTASADEALRRAALADEQVVLVQKVIGGDLESVRPA